MHCSGENASQSDEGIPGIKVKSNSKGHLICHFDKITLYNAIVTLDISKTTHTTLCPTHDLFYMASSEVMP